MFFDLELKNYPLIALGKKYKLYFKKLTTKTTP